MAVDYENKETSTVALPLTAASQEADKERPVEPATPLDSADQGADALEITPEANSLSGIHTYLSSDTLRSLP